jgi:diguanylate cyclase (GGDEF)-like protein
VRLRAQPAPPPAQVLLAEGSATISRFLAKSIAGLPGCQVQVVTTCEQVAAALAQQPERFTAAVVDFDLGAAPGEAVDRVLAAGVPTLVLAGQYDERTRSAILDRPVVDYFVKGGKNLSAINEAIDRLRVNPGVRILVVDDSSAFRLLGKRMLEIHRFTVLEAADGVHALEVLEAEPEIVLVITDYEMPRMNGVELVSNLRAQRGRDRLAIIGVSSLGDRALPARYLKHGADDFLTKPFEKEEFYCRVYRSVVNIEQIQRITRAAYTDPLTQLSNRLHFFSTAPALYQQAMAERAPVAVAMLDIDFFKRINDTYGHAGGDLALQHLARLLGEQLGEADVVARFGGEEFCALFAGRDLASARALLEQLRAVVEASSVAFEGRVIRFTLSIGIAAGADGLDAAINRADELLYQAKQGGRNRVVVEPTAGDPPRSEP